MLVCLNAVSAAQQVNSGLNPAQCPAKAREIASNEQATIRCAWFLAPEDRQRPQNDRRVELFVLTILAQEPLGNKPLLYLAGGPGDAASDDLAFWLKSGFHQDYDIILVDQRGTGLSRPALDCPEIDSNDQWIQACRMRLVNEGIDLLVYDTMAIVQDMHELLRAMEIEGINVFGSSFGSRLALLLADAAPERIRSLVLDGVYPPTRSAVVDMAYNAELALERLFHDCDMAPACRASVPELRLKLYQAIAEMNEEPAEIYHLGEDSGFDMSGDQFLLWTIGMLRYPDAVPFLPSLIEAFYLGFYDLLLSIAAFAKAPNWEHDSSHSEGAFLSVRCSEDLALAAPQRWQAEHQNASEAIRRSLSPIARKHFADCEIWDVRPAPALLGREVKSDVPALLLSGAYDSATPPYYGDVASEHLGASWHYVFPNVGHNVLEAEPCASLIMHAFLRDPEQQPSHACFATLHPPDFALERAG